MEPTDLTIEILKGIRDRIDVTNERVDSLRTELKGEVSALRTELKGEISALRTDFSSLKGQVSSSEIRTGTAITELIGAVHEMTDVLRASHDLRPRVDRCERDIIDIKQRLGGG